MKRWMCFFLASVVNAIIVSVIYGGFKGLFDYRRAVNPDLEINMSVLHFFTKEYIARQYNFLTVENHLSESSLPSFRIYTDESDFASLNSNLPESGKAQSISGHIKVDNPNFSSAMNFRYRGGLPMHWLYDKKSFRINLPKHRTFYGLRKFDLVNPSTKETIIDDISYQMASEIGLLTPDYFPVNVYVNDKYNGVHYFLSKVDESFLRKNKRMPGSIYSGDTIRVASPFPSSDRPNQNVVFKENDIPLIWSDYRLWEKDSSRNSESESDKEDIKKYLEIINQTDPVIFMTEFERYFDTEKHYKYWGLDTITGTYHHDLFHNHKVYFDPYKGKFEPIEWDLRFWSSMYAAKDLPVYPLLKQVKLNPILEYKRDKVSYELLLKYPKNMIHKRILDAQAKIINDLKSDPFRHAPDNLWTRFTPDKVVPFSIREHEESIKELKLIYSYRSKLLKTIYEKASVQFVIEQEKKNSIILTVEVNGNSPVRMNFSSMFRSNSGLTLTKFLDGIPVESKILGDEVLYPGRTIVPGNILGRVDNWARMAFGNEKIVESPLYYQFRITSESEISLSPADFKVVNAITGSKIKPSEVKSFENLTSSDSIHPWKLLKQTNLPKESIELKGVIDLTEDLVFEPNQSVKIVKGTRFKIAPDVSIIFQGKVDISGTEMEPVVFEPMDKDMPWGSIVLQGQSASGSQLSHFVVRGGSVTRFGLVNYPGELNIHDLDSFDISHCQISDNQIGDDALHVAYSNGKISNCEFTNTAFDALDMDIVHVQVSNSTFHKIGNDALDLMTSEVNIHDIYVDGAGDKCISIGEASTIGVFNSNLTHCEIGIAVKDNSVAQIENINFKGNRQAPISLYRKNTRYNMGGTLRAKGLDSGITDKIQKDDWSDVTLN